MWYVAIPHLMLHTYSQSKIQCLVVPKCTIVQWNKSSKCLSTCLKHCWESLVMCRWIIPVSKWKILSLPWLLGRLCQNWGRHRSQIRVLTLWDRWPNSSSIKFISPEGGHQWTFMSIKNNTYPHRVEITCFSYAFCRKYMQFSHTHTQKENFYLLRIFIILSNLYQLLIQHCSLSMFL